jgi:hypothetical protein
MAEDRLRWSTKRCQGATNARLPIGLRSATRTLGRRRCGHCCECSARAELLAAHNDPDSGERDGVGWGRGDNGRSASGKREPRQWTTDIRSGRWATLSLGRADSRAAQRSDAGLDQQTRRAGRWGAESPDHLPVLGCCRRGVALLEHPVLARQLIATSGRPSARRHQPTSHGARRGTRHVFRHRQRPGYANAVPRWRRADPNSARPEG